MGILRNQFRCVVLWIVFAIHCALHISPAGAQTVRDVFKAMPDSLMPYLTENNRLDMMDFMDAGMKAEVTNRLDGKSVMTVLTADSLCITMSPSLCVTLALEARGDSTVVRLQRDYTVSEHQKERVVQYFSSVWCPLSSAMVVSSSLLR